MTKSNVIEAIYNNYKKNHSTVFTAKNKNNEVVFSKALCEEIIDGFTEEVKNCLLSGERVILRGFATFEVHERKEREGRNPKTGDIVKFPAVKSIRCKMSKSIKDAVNGK